MKELNKSNPEVDQLINTLYKNESGKVIGVLVNLLGTENFSLAEDIVQEAFITALEKWSLDRVPDSPLAWVIQVAKNLGLNALKRDKNFQNKKNDVIQELKNSSAYNYYSAETLSDEIKDSQLKMIFVCCNPLISAESRIALALKTLCGLSIGEIANAFLTQEKTIEQRLFRAKEKIRAAKISFEIPQGELAKRLGTVHEVIYLMFNEGYNSSQSKSFIRVDLCKEALYLCFLLTEFTLTDTADTNALLSLMLFHISRFKSRTDDRGFPLSLSEQDRNLWDKAIIEKGMFHFNKSLEEKKKSEYHFQAGIALCHCAAENYLSTNWTQILTLYDHLIAISNSSVFLLNRIVALSKVDGPTKALAELQKLKKLKPLQDYYLLYAVEAELQSELKNYAEAINLFEKALKLCQSVHIKEVMTKKLNQCEEKNE